MSKESLLQDAINVLSEATNLDKSGRSNDALLKYTSGVEKLVEYIRSLPSDDHRKTPFAEKVAQYLNRAEELKLQVRHTVDVLEQRRIAADSIGHSYESVFSKCLNDKLTAVYVQDAYIIAHHQMTKSEEPNKELNEFKQELFVEAERLVTKEFPRRVLHFESLLQSSRFSYDRLSEIMPKDDLNIPIPEIGSEEPLKKRMKITDDDGHELNGAPVYGFIRGTVPCNDKLAELMDDVRPLLRDAVESVNKVKMWITFLIPRIEDGNNFGVGIQEEALNEVRNVESEAASFLDQMSRYFTSRAKLLTKVAKYPHVSDYRRAILDMDEKQFINIRLVILEVRNHYSTLHDLITKNMEKIKKPRNTNMDVMY